MRPPGRAPTNKNATPTTPESEEEDFVSPLLSRGDWRQTMHPHSPFQDEPLTTIGVTCCRAVDRTDSLVRLYVQSPNHLNFFAKPRNDWSKFQLIGTQFTFRFDNRVAILHQDAQPEVPRAVPYTVGARLRRKRQLVVRHQEFQVQGGDLVSAWEHL